MVVKQKAIINKTTDRYSSYRLLIFDEKNVYGLYLGTQRELFPCQNFAAALQKALRIMPKAVSKFHASNASKHRMLINLARLV
jgi:hypothetical protein